MHIWAHVFTHGIQKIPAEVAQQHLSLAEVSILFLHAKITPAARNKLEALVRRQPRAAKKRSGPRAAQCWWFPGFQLCEWMVLSLPWLGSKF